MLFDKIQPLYFFIAFAVGILYCYISSPKPKLIMKFPSPYNAGKVVYSDKADNCYKYKADKVDCPIDKSVIKDQPIIDD